MVGVQGSRSDHEESPEVEKSPQASGIAYPTPWRWAFVRRHTLTEASRRSTGEEDQDLYLPRDWKPTAFFVVRNFRQSRELIRRTWSEPNSCRVEVRRGAELRQVEAFFAGMLLPAPGLLLESLSEWLRNITNPGTANWLDRSSARTGGLFAAERAQPTPKSSPERFCRREAGICRRDVLPETTYSSTCLCSERVFAKTNCPSRG